MVVISAWRVSWASEQPSLFPSPKTDLSVETGPLGTDANQRSVVSARITGRVQGVWYRGWTQEEAIKRQLDGWVRNRQDGSVEALFSGTSAQVTEMIEACRTGPPMARVDDVQVTAVESDSVAVGQGFDTLGSN